MSRIRELKVGKVPPDVLGSVILSHLGAKRDDVLVHSKIGEDCSVIDFGEFVCVVSTDPITGAVRDIGRLAVHISCNDVAANGAEPIGLLLTILAPSGAREEDFEMVMHQADEAARKLNVEVLGGHTEVTPVVERIVLVSTVIGKARKGEFVTSSGAGPGDQVILTKAAGIEGTAILASDFEGSLRGRLDPEVISRAKGFIDDISVVPEGLIATRNGATAMHDVTEGGVVSALYEVSEASGVGLKIWEHKIPVRPETREICRVFGVDPLRLVSSGSMVITARDGAKVVQALRANGIPAEIIGEVTDRNEGRILIRPGEVQEGRASQASGWEAHELALPERDELYRMLEYAHKNAQENEKT